MRDREPRAYTPKHLADGILSSRSVLEGERKQVTVLFVDVKGSLALAEQLDPEQWHRVLDRFFRILTDAVHRFEGTVNQYLGDGIMALFGAPIAHEDHAQRACHAALRIADGLRHFGDDFRRTHGLEFPVRMGLNSGEVVVGRIGDDLRMDYTAQGHAVGLAHRAERLAEPGTICVTEAVANLVRGFFRLKPLGRRAAPGASAGIVLFELEAPGGARTRLDLLDRAGWSRFVGRSGAMASLEKGLARALGGRGLALGVEGAPGVGKSRLCLELVARCRQRGLVVAEAHCPAHGRTLPHFAMFELLRSLVVAADGADLPAGLAETWPLLLDGLGLGGDRAALPGSDADERERRLSLVACHVIRARAEREPTILLIDDLHWIDAASEAFLAHLVGSIAGTRALLLVNFRSEYRAAWMEHGSFHRIGLPPLDRAASLRLIRGLVGGDPSVQDLPGLVYERVGGNPLFIEESLRSLVESGRLEAAPGGLAWRDAARELEIPATVRAVLAARIDRLAEAEKRLLQVAAVLGKRFERAVLAQVVGVPELDLDPTLRALEAAEFLRRETLYRSFEYAFKHPLTREVAYESLLSERRVEIHAEVARVLEASQERLGARADLIAHHLEAANRPHDAALWRRRAGFRVTNLVPRRSWRDRVGGS